MKTRLLKHLTKVLFLILLLHLTSPQQYQLPPITQLQQKNIKLNQIKYLNQPNNINLTKIYKRQIYQTAQTPYNTKNDTNYYKDSKICKEQAPEITFNYMGYYGLFELDAYVDGNDSKAQYKQQRIIYDYEVLKSKYENILDMYQYSKFIFTISSTGIITILKINPVNQNGLQFIKSIKAIDLDDLNKKRYNQWKQREDKQRDRISQVNNTLLGGGSVNRLLQSTDQPEIPLPKNDSTIYSQYYTGPPPIPLIPHLSKGYFQLIQNNNTLIFANNEFLIALDIRTFNAFLLSQQLQYDTMIMQANVKVSPTNQQPNSSNDTSSPTNYPTIGMIPPVIRQYTQLLYFEQIAQIDETHFAVVDRKNGVYIYELVRCNKTDKNMSQSLPDLMIRQVEHLTKQSFVKTYQEYQQLNLVDISYNKKKNVLFVLDYEKGVFSFDVSKTLSQGQTKLTIKFNYNAILKKSCSLMQFSQLQQNLYLVCNKIYRLNLQNWPITSQKTFPHPLIHIKQIFIQQEQNLFILAGYTVFKIIYLDRTTNYFQDDMLDKLIFRNDYVITANQNHIIVLNYKIQKPKVICQANDLGELGIHHMVMRTTAECSQEYLLKMGYQKMYEKKFERNDVCVYTVFKNVYVWELGEVPLKPLAIIMLLFLIFMTVMVIWFILVKIRVQRAQQHLKYLSQQGHKELVEQDVKSQRNQQFVPQKSQQFKQYNSQIDQNQPTGQNRQQKNTTQQQQINKDFYSIQ